MLDEEERKKNKIVRYKQDRLIRPWAQRPPAGCLVKATPVKAASFIGEVNFHSEPAGGAVNKSASQ